MYFAGLAGVLLYATYALFGIGIVLLIALLTTKKIKQAFNVFLTERDQLRVFDCVSPLLPR